MFSEKPMQQNKEIPAIASKALRLDGIVYKADNHALAFADLTKDNPDFNADEDMHLIDYGFLTTDDEFIFADDYARLKKDHD